ncbi:MAG: methionine--tRNA ligase subunit beta [bacterium]|nr:methionine--tRNA ligase subunit beta [bacterium]
MITYDDFKKLELVVAEVLEVERVEGSEKLLKLKVNIGKEERQIIAGIGKEYEPEFMVGKKIVVIANLEPRQLMGLESQGMLLAADNEGKPVFLMPEKDAPAGSPVK